MGDSLIECWAPSDTLRMARMQDSVALLTQEDSGFWLLRGSRKLLRVILYSAISRIMSRQLLRGTSHLSGKSDPNVSSESSRPSGVKSTSIRLSGITEGCPLLWVVNQLPEWFDRESLPEKVDRDSSLLR